MTWRRTWRRIRSSTCRGPTRVFAETLGRNNEHRTCSDNHANRRRMNGTLKIEFIMGYRFLDSSNFTSRLTIAEIRWRAR